MSPEDYNKMLLAQKGTCAICNGVNKTRPLFVDHDHKTDKVRGLLCRNCNLALGYLKDDPSRLEKAKVYLVRPRT